MKNVWPGLEEPGWADRWGLVGAGRALEGNTGWGHGMHSLVGGWQSWAAWFFPPWYWRMGCIVALGGPLV